MGNKMGNTLDKVTKVQKRMKHLFDVFEGKTPRVLILGLDGAGKSTLLYSAKLDDTVYVNVPANGINIEHVRAKRGATLQVYDMTGSKLTRHVWYTWFRRTEAIIYVIDSADKVRLDEAKFVLNEVLQSEDLHPKCPVVIVANKQDAADCMRPQLVSTKLELDNITGRDWSILGTSTESGEGINQVFEDVADKIIAFRHYRSGLSVKHKAKTENSDNTENSENTEKKRSSTFGKLKKMTNKSKKSKAAPVAPGSDFSNIEAGQANVDVDDNDDETNKSDIPSLFDSINKASSSNSDSNSHNKITNLDDDDNEETNANERDTEQDTSADAAMAMYDDITKVDSDNEAKGEFVESRNEITAEAINEIKHETQTEPRFEAKNEVSVRSVDSSDSDSVSDMDLPTDFV